jgi:hypothetical protein
MNKYVVMYNSIDYGNNLMYDYEVIEGKTPKEALKNRFNKEFKRLTGDDGRYAEVILVKGDFRDNTVYHKGRYQQLCYGRI